MSEEKTNNLFNEKFQDFEARPAADSLNQVWSKLELLQKNKRRRLALWFLSGLTASLLSLLWLTSTPDKPKELSYLETQVFEKEKAAKNINETKPSEKNAHTGTQVSKTSQFPGAPAKKILAAEQPETKAVGLSQEVAIGLNAAQNIQSLQNAQDSYSESKHSENAEPETSNNPFQLVDATLNEATGDFVPLPLLHVKFSVDTFEIKPWTSTLREEDKNLLRLKARRFSPLFFAGLSFQPTLMNYQITENHSSPVPLVYSTNESNAYIKKRKAEKQFNLTFVPGLKLGVILRNGLVIGATAGFYKTSDKETVELTKIDTIVVTPVKSFTNNGLNPSANVKSTSVSTETQEYINRFSYGFASLDLGWMIQKLNYRVMPALSLGYHKITKASYVVLDQTGYSYRENDAKFLNKAIYTLSFKLVLRREIRRNFDLQMNPVFVYSPSSVFSKDYFVSQKPFGFGFEGALLYRFRL